MQMRWLGPPDFDEERGYRASHTPGGGVAIGGSRDWWVQCPPCKKWTHEENVRDEGKSEVRRKRGRRRSKDEENEEGRREVVFREEARCLT